jgi:hypothetical protein
VSGRGGVQIIVRVDEKEVDKQVRNVEMSEGMEKQS